MDLTGLRDFVVSENDRVGPMRLSELYREALTGPASASVGSAPVSRAQFYRWFGSERATPDSGLLELIPGLANVLGLPESRLLAEAGFKKLAEAHGVELQREVRLLREHLRNLHKMLNQSSFTDQSEALVVDRILRARLDYEIGVWPVVRGTSFPMQLRSWISLRRIPTRSLRPATTDLEGRGIVARREYIRRNVITDELWRHLGLRWRVEQPVEWPSKQQDSPLRIELPVDERNQGATSAAFDCPPPLASRTLVVSGLWGHAETLSALLAAALNWRSIDLRYMGFWNEDAEAQAFVRDELQLRQPHVVWSVAQRSKFFSSLSRVVDAVPEQLIVLITYGPALTRHASDAFRKVTPATIEESQQAAVALASRLNQRMPVLHVRLADVDLAVGRARRISVDLVIDHIRYAAIEILDKMERHTGGPRPQTWRHRERFKDAAEVLTTSRRSRVTWNEPGQLDSANLSQE